MTLSNNCCVFRNTFIFSIVLTPFLTGCSQPIQPSSLTSSVEVNEITKPMVGTWGIDNEEALYISLINDRIVISSPENEAWRISIQNAKIDKKSIVYTQTNYLKNGDSHPFNGVKCQTKISLTLDKKLKQSVTTIQMPKAESALLTRMEE